MAELDSDLYLNVSSFVPVGGQSDGVFYERATGDLLAVVNSNVTARFPDSRNVTVFEDFIGKALNVTDAVWAIKDVSSSGTPTYAIKGDESNGAFELKFDNTSEDQTVGLYWNDEQNILYSGKPIFQCRLKVPTLPNANDTIVFGLMSAWNATEDSVATNAWFRLQGATLVPALETDDGTTDKDDKVTDQVFTMTADTYYEFRIDCSDTSNVKFYYRATLGGTWTQLTTTGTTFTIAANSTNLQPVFQIHKSSGTQTTNIIIDYVKVTWLRG